MEVTQKDLEAAMRGLVAAGARSAPPAARRLPQYCAPLLAAQVKAAAELLTEPTLSTVGRYFCFIFFYIQASRGVEDKV